jgi:hypothetical protein
MKRGISGLLLAATVALAPRALAVPTTVSLAPVADTTIFSEDGTLASGADDGVFVGLTRANASRRALLRFDLSSIPTNAVVSSAVLTMSVTRASNSPLDVDVAVYRLQSAWGEGTSIAGAGGGAGGTATTDSATWTHRLWQTTTWGAPGGDFAASASTTRSIGAIGSYSWPSTVAMVGDVEDWVQDAASNHGWILVAADLGTSVTAKRLGARELSIPAQRPRLDVTFDLAPQVAPRQLPLPIWASVLVAIAVLHVRWRWQSRR